MAMAVQDAVAEHSKAVERADNEGGGGGGASGTGNGKSSHYGPAGTVEESGEAEAKKPRAVDAANFGLSGALTKDVSSGMVYKVRC